VSFHTPLFFRRPLLPLAFSSVGNFLHEGPVCRRTPPLGIFYSPLFGRLFLNVDKIKPLFVGRRPPLSFLYLRVLPGDVRVVKVRDARCSLPIHDSHQDRPHPSDGASPPAFLSTFQAFVPSWPVSPELTVWPCQEFFLLPTPPSSFGRLLFVRFLLPFCSAVVASPFGEPPPPPPIFFRPLGAFLPAMTAARRRTEGTPAIFFPPLLFWAYLLPSEPSRILSPHFDLSFPPRGHVAPVSCLRFLQQNFRS